MVKSKYIKSPTEFYTMTNKELRVYIRNASKTLTKRLSRLRESPFAPFSETLDRWENEQVFLRGKGFSTTNKTTAELIDTAQVINSVLSVEESPAKLRDIVDRDILEDFARGGLANFDEYFLDNQVELATKWAKRYWAMYEDLLKSSEISELAQTYGESPQFYTEALKIAATRATQKDISEYEKWWKQINKYKKWS